VPLLLQRVFGESAYCHFKAVELVMNASRQGRGEWIEIEFQSGQVKSLPMHVYHAVGLVPLWMIGTGGIGYGCPIF
jgi:hypothetical protein